MFLHSSPSWQQAVVGSRSLSYLEVERTVTETSPQLSPALVQDLFKTTSMWVEAMVGKISQTYLWNLETLTSHERIPH